MHKCYSNRAYTIATVTVHICTVTIAFVHLIFYYYFFSLILFTPSLFLNTLSLSSLFVSQSLSQASPSALLPASPFALICVLGHCCRLLHVGSSPFLTLSDLYFHWFSFVSSGFWDFDKWVFGSLDLGRLMMVA